MLAKVKNKPGDASSMIIALATMTAAIYAAEPSKHTIKDIELALKKVGSQTTSEGFHNAEKLINLLDSSSREMQLKRFELTAKLAGILAPVVEADTKRASEVSIPSGNVSPPFDPKGTEFFAAGMSPKSIKDPVLRKQYEDRIKENSQNARFWSEHNAKKQQLAGFVFILGAQAAYLFAQDKEGIARLRQVLAEQKIPDTLAELIVKRERLRQP